MYKVIVENPYMNTSNKFEYTDVEEAICKFNDIHIGCVSEFYMSNVLMATYTNFGESYSEIVFTDEASKEFLKNQI